MKDEKINEISTSTYAGKAAKAVKQKAQSIISDGLITFTLLDFISFIQINNMFADQGIFITNENKEQKYIEIIESGDEKLISFLEEYINLLDNIKNINNKKTEYQTIIYQLQTINDKDNIEEINKIVEEYLRR